MKVRAILRDKDQSIIAEEILDLSNEPMYGRSAAEIEEIVSMYVNTWSRKHVSVSFDIIDRNSGGFEHVDWEKR